MLSVFPRLCVDVMQFCSESAGCHFAEKKLSSGSHKVSLTEIELLGLYVFIPTSPFWVAHFIASPPSAENPSHASGWPGMIKFRMVTHAGGRRFSRGSTTPPDPGRCGPSLPFLGFPQCTMIRRTLLTSIAGSDSDMPDVINTPSTAPFTPRLNTLLQDCAWRDCNKFLKYFFFEFSNVSKTIGHAYKLCKAHCNYNTRYRFLLKELTKCGIPWQKQLTWATLVILKAVFLIYTSLISFGNVI